MAQRSSRKRRKQRRRTARQPDRTQAADADDKLIAPRGEDPETTAARGYARGREKDEAARAALEPLAQGERPRAVTVAAIFAAVLAIAEVVSFALGYSPGEEGKIARSAVVVTLLGVMAAGMWRAKYWAVLGMQALLGLTLVLAFVALIRASNLNALLLIVAIVVPCGALFWFLVKAMARIQMPERPGSR